MTYHRDIEFDKYDWLYWDDVQRCPHPPFTKAAGEWLRGDDHRMLLLALERYACFLERRRCII